MSDDKLSGKMEEAEDLRRQLAERRRAVSGGDEDAAKRVQESLLDAEIEYLKDQLDEQERADERRHPLAEDPVAYGKALMEEAAAAELATPKETKAKTAAATKQEAAAKKAAEEAAASKTGGSN